MKGAARGVPHHAPQDVAGVAPDVHADGLRPQDALQDEFGEQVVVGVFVDAAELQREFGTRQPV
jgi:hypothetical protein